MLSFITNFGPVILLAVSSIIILAYLLKQPKSEQKPSHTTFLSAALVLNIAAIILILFTSRFILSIG